MLRSSRNNWDRIAGHLDQRTIIEIIWPRLSQKTWDFDLKVHLLALRHGILRFWIFLGRDVTEWPLWKRFRLIATELGCYSDNSLFSLHPFYVFRRPKKALTYILSGNELSSKDESNIWSITALHVDFPYLLTKTHPRKISLQSKKKILVHSHGRSESKRCYGNFRVCQIWSSTDQHNRLRVKVPRWKEFN